MVFQSLGRTQCPDAVRWSVVTFHRLGDHPALLRWVEGAELDQVEVPHRPTLAWHPQPIVCWRLKTDAVLRAGMDPK